MSGTYPIRLLLGAAVDFVRPRPVDPDLAAPTPSGAVARYFLLVAFLGAGVFAASVFLDWHVATPSPAFVIGLLAAVVVGDHIATPKRRRDNVLTVFSDMLLLVAVAHFGLHWSLLAVLVVSEALRYGRILPMTGGPLGAAFNIGTHMIECCIVAGVVALVGPMPTLALAAVVAATVFVVTCVAMGLIGLLTGDGTTMGRSTVISEYWLLTANFPFYILALFTMSASPFAALIGMLGPTLLAFASTHAQEELRAAELELDLDGLTGIANRRRFSAELEAAHLDARGTGTAVAVLMLDIDNFKRLNDTHGHAEGDTALVATARAVTSAMGHGQVAARIGGEEFAAVLAGVGVEDAVECAERARSAARFALQPWGGSVSIGVAIGYGGEFTPEELLRRADVALYESKSTGKDRVTLAGDDDAQQASIA